jgi:predicted ATPase
MGFYNFNPDEIRDLQPPDAGQVLLRDGRNLASVLSLMGTQNPAAKAQVVELLSKVVPGVVDVTARHVGNKETIEMIRAPIPVVAGQLLVVYKDGIVAYATDTAGKKQ